MRATALLVGLAFGLGASAAAPSVAQTIAPRPAAQPGVAYPQFVGEVGLGLYAIGTPRASDSRREGTSTFLFGETANGLYLSPTVSVQSVIHVEPVGEGEPSGGLIGFRRQGAYVEALHLDWRVSDTLSLYAGKFSAPFGRGHHDFPGILTLIRAHETYLVSESVGFGATWTFLSDPVFGEHDLSAAVFTLDTSFLSNTLLTRRRCCAEGFERYSQNTRDQGGVGNTGRLNNFAVALDGDGFSFLPNVSYHLAVLSRDAGRDGTSREWGYAAGLRYEARWTPAVRTLFFLEHVEFRPAGGRPVEEVTTPLGRTDESESIETTEALPTSEHRRFTTAGARTSYGPWRATLAWQQDEGKRSVSPRPTENYVEVSVGRDLGWGFSADVGYQYARYAREEGGRGEANSLLGVLRFRTSF